MPPLDLPMPDIGNCICGCSGLLTCMPTTKFGQIWHPLGQYFPGMEYYFVSCRSSACHMEGPPYLCCAGAAPDREAERLAIEGWNLMIYHAIYRAAGKGQSTDCHRAKHAGWFQRWRWRRAVRKTEALVAASIIHYRNATRPNTSVYDGDDPSISDTRADRRLYNQTLAKIHDHLRRHVGVLNDIDPNLMDQAVALKLITRGRGTPRTLKTGL